MIKVQQRDVDAAGGFLGALSMVSVNAVAELLESYVRPSSFPPPDRLIAHTNPHLDEYFAILIFRASLPQTARVRHYQEQTLYSKQRDTYSSQVWPISAVFGIGNGTDSAPSALALYDEHEESGGRKTRSCAGMVAMDRFTGLPESVKQVLDEVNHIDIYGQAHTMHLGNLIKSLHETPFFVGEIETEYAKNPWKRSVVDALLTACMVYVAKGYDLLDVDSARRAVKAVVPDLLARSPRRLHPSFTSVQAGLSSELQDVAKIFKNAKLRTSRDDSSTGNPQRLTFPSLCSAAVEVWGQEVAKFLLSHLVEALICQQIGFKRTVSAITSRFKEDTESRQRRGQVHTQIGLLYSRVLEGVKFTGQRDQNGRSLERHNIPIWLLSVTPNRDVTQVNKAMMNSLKEISWGVGIILINNSVNQTKALFKGSSIPDAYWSKVVDLLDRSEPGLWFINRNSNGIAGFVLNGNPAHQYVPQSNLNIAMLADICREAWRS